MVYKGIRKDVIGVVVLFDEILIFEYTLSRKRIKLTYK